MKKLYLCILALFLFSTLLMAQVESDPSEIVGYVAYDCLTLVDGADLLGNNLIALALEKEHNTAVALGQSFPEGDINAITPWDPAGQAWDDSAAYDEIAGWFGDFALGQGYVYMINVTTAFTFYSKGLLLPDVQRDLLYDAVEDSGNNLVMVPLSKNELSDAIALANDIGAVGVCNVVTPWDSEGQAWDDSAAYDEIAGWFGNFNIEIAMPLMINVTEEVLSWPAAETRFQASN
jgi:hypothetical protein